MTDSGSDKSLLGWPEWVWRGLVEGWCKPLGGVTVEATLHGDGRNQCWRPVERTLRFDNSPLKGATRAYVRLKMRCRECEPCIRYKRSQWAFRALREIRVADRTWFTTLTFNPWTRNAMVVRAMQRAGTSEIWQQMSPRAQSHALCLEAGKYITQFMKRLRKNAFTRRGGKLRFFCVFEAHKDGFPHAHLLIHERGAGTREEEIREAWRGNGFARGKLLNVENPEKAAWYCMKYFTKDANRVRASIRYGNEPAIDEEAFRVSEEQSKQREKPLTPKNRDVLRAAMSGEENDEGIFLPSSRAPALEEAGLWDEKQTATYRRWRFNAVMHYAPELARQGREARRDMSQAYIQGLGLILGDRGDYVDDSYGIERVALSKPGLQSRGRDVHSSPSPGTGPDYGDPGEVQEIPSGFEARLGTDPPY